MVEVFTVGGGDYLVNVFQAVAAWTGDGGYKSLLQVVMVMGLAPVVGIPLPWISHGGSALMTNMICIGSIMAVDRWSKRGGSLSG